MNRGFCRNEEVAVRVGARGSRDIDQHLFVPPATLFRVSQVLGNPTPLAATERERVASTHPRFSRLLTRRGEPHCDLMLGRLDDDPSQVEWSEVVFVVAFFDGEVRCLVAADFVE